MRIILALVLAFVAVTTEAQGVRRDSPIPAVSLFPGYLANYTNGVNVGGYPALEAPFRFTKWAVFVGVASGGGAAANTVLTMTDGTNTCTFTLPCTTSQSTGAYEVAAVNGAGTGCSYATGATVTVSVTTAGCTTTQPAPRTSLFVGKWL